MVYRATDLNLNRPVAVKQLKPELSEDPRFAKLFRSEAHLAGQLHHPNIVTVHDWSADDDRLDGGAYIVTELLAGGTLRDMLASDGPLATDQAAFIGLQVANGLRAAHGAELVHRDIKPANLLFGHDGRVRIGDFGIARAVAVAAWTEPKGSLIGTARYAAPEQARTGAVDGRADVYSLAVCMIEAVTGEVPLVGVTGVATMTIRQQEDLPVPAGLDYFGELLSWAGHADPAQRPDAESLVAELAIYCRDLPEPEPLALVDLTSIGTSIPVSRDEPAGRAEADLETPSIAIEPDRILLVDGAAVDGGAVDGGAVDGGAVDGGGSRASVRSRGALEDHTADNYLTTVDPDSRGRRSGRAWLLGLVAVLLLVAAGAGGFVWMQGQSEELSAKSVEVGFPSWPVPDFAAEVAAATDSNGQGSFNVDEARALVEPFEWTLTVAERHEDGTVVGQLIEQVPEPGRQLGRGATVELVLSLGPLPREVPMLVGLSEDEASQALGGVSLVVGSVTEENDEVAEAGTVLAATIAGAPAAPGTEYPTGTAVDLVVSAGPSPRTVPAVVGATVEQARLAVGEVNLNLAVTEAHSDSVPEGQIISVSPEAGAQVPRNSTVTVTVSLGRPFVVVPEVAGQSVEEAIAQLQALGLVVRLDGAVDATVLATRPVAGTSLRVGSEIDVFSDR